MERLNIVEAPENKTIESALYLTRYATALHYCQGKRVLDVACGEGYGSKLLMDAGASNVVGIDIYEEAIVQAQNNFANSNITFHCANVIDLKLMFDTGTFDLIVSLETIEHLQEPISFLKAIKQLATEEAIIIISCPNDNWYFPSDNDSNPFHIKKYSFEEFRELTIHILGKNVLWMLGTAAFGFANVPLGKNNDVEGWQTFSEQSWMRYQHNVAGLMVPTAQNDKLQTKNCSYFLGIWGTGLEKKLPSATIFPISMDAYAASVGALLHFWKTKVQVANKEESHKASKLNNEPKQEYVDGLELDVQKFRLQAATLALENDILRNNVQDLTTQISSIKQREHDMEAQIAFLEPYHLIVIRISQFVPRFIRSFLRRILRFANK